MKINKDQIIVSRREKLKFEYLRSRGHLFAYLLNRFQWHYFPRLRRVCRFPGHVDIEISSICNMRCPMCYTITEDFKSGVKKEFMDFGLFKKIIDECVKYKAYSIRISLRGEPFLHNDVVQMISYAKDKGIREVSSLTNNLALTPALFEKAMHAGLDWLTVSFDGLGRIYEDIRKPARFQESYAKIKEYKAVKSKAHSLKPVVKVQTILPAIQGYAQEYFDAFRPYVEHIAINPLIDYCHEDKDIVYHENFSCPVLYQRLAVASDGKILLCPNDEFSSFPIGDANRHSLYETWHGSELSRARMAHQQREGVKVLAPCKLCYLPRKTHKVTENLGGRAIKIDKYINRPDKVTGLKDAYNHTSA